MPRLNISPSNASTNWLSSELIYWLNVPSYPPVWSRLCQRNVANIKRHISQSKFRAYDIEIPGELWSIWGYLHPQNNIFSNKTRGRQAVACNILACCAIKIYPLVHWSSRLMDSIIISGDRYFRESIDNNNCDEVHLSLEDLNCQCKLENIYFKVHTEVVAYGALYEDDRSQIKNLAKGLIYFFSKNKMGILRCRQRVLTIGRDSGKCGDYFIYDCQSMEYPLFRKGDGVPYLLRCKSLQMLLYCIVMALEVRCRKVQYTLHKVEVKYEGSDNDEPEDRVMQVRRIIAERQQKSYKSNKKNDLNKRNRCKR